jgi:hypothetical protein
MPHTNHAIGTIPAAVILEQLGWIVDLARGLGETTANDIVSNGIAKQVMIRAAELRDLISDELAGEEDFHLVDDTSSISPVAAPHAAA